MPFQIVEYPFLQNRIDVGTTWTSTHLLRAGTCPE